MSATADNSDRTYSQRLASFAGELRDHVDDEFMLREIHTAIKSMLSADGVSEREIRSALQRQFDAGKLRLESFELVQKLIDRIVLDNPASKAPETDAVSPDDVFSSTAVLDQVELGPAMDREVQPGTVLRERFLLQKEISGGSMGTVFKAMDRRLAEAADGDHWVAIKVLAPRLSENGKALRALQQEAAKMRCLTHKNIVRFIDLDREDELYFMVMEWLEGKTLARILDDSPSKKIDLEMALDIVSQVGRALEYAHQRGVVHADVKPANIMVTPSGAVKLFDFGIARIRQQQDDQVPEFDPGVLNAVSPAYSSMQVLTGEVPVPADDVFSLACLAYRLIAGYRVFGPRNAAEAAEAGMEPQRLEGLSKTQWNVMRKALSFSRVTRFASPTEFVDALVNENASAVEYEDTQSVEALDDRPSHWRAVGLFVIFVAAAVAVFQTDLLDLIDGDIEPASRSTPTAITREPTGDARPQDGEAVSDVPDPESSGEIEPVTVDAAAVSEPGQLPDSAPEQLAEPVQDAALKQTEDVSAQSLPTELQQLPGDVTEPVVDFSTLPPAGAEIVIEALEDNPTIASLVVMEDAGGLIVDLVRPEPYELPLHLVLVEENINGSRSAWLAGQYSISNHGRLDFPSGQSRARVTITMSSDPVRESDRVVQLVVRDADYQDIEYGRFRIDLQDDDQRAFEKGLQPNTVAFAVSQVSVREHEAAVQVDVLRYKPDDQPLEASYILRNVTATEGADYVGAGDNVIRFGPGQRSARILIPLVQDSTPEGDEAFMLELSDDTGRNQSNIYRRIAVMIRDDDT